MTRATIFIAIFLVTLNGVSGALAASGAADDWGIDPETGVENDKVNDATKGATPSSNDSDGIIGLVFWVFGKVGSVIDFVFKAPTMFANLGVPDYLVALFFAPQYVLVFADLVYIAIGRLI